MKMPVIRSGIVRVLVGMWLVMFGGYNAYRAVELFWEGNTYWWRFGFSALFAAGLLDVCVVLPWLMARLSPNHGRIIDIDIILSNSVENASEEGTGNEEQSL